MVDFPHYYPEQQYLGQTILSEIHEDTGNAYIEIVTQYDIESGVYLSNYFEIPIEGEPELVVGHLYTAKELDEILEESIR